MIIEIIYEGNDIAPWTILADASFTTRTDGNPGEAILRVKDVDHIFPPQYYDHDTNEMVPGFFHAGGTLVLYIDGIPEWRGWVMAASVVYAFPVDDTQTPATTPRFWVLNGADVNLAFQRRYLYKRANPSSNKRFPIYPAGTLDKDVIQDFVEKFVDVGGLPMLYDGEFPDTTKVQTIASPDPEQEFLVGSVGEPLSVLFTDICQITGGVFYIDPDGYLVYADDSAATAPYRLTDHPLTAGDVGYREMEISSKADAMANDALVWGAGKGSSDPVFARYEDAASVALHGRFQWADQFSGSWKEATVLRRARTYVLGSPSHRRGHKDDQDFLSCTVFRQGFRAAQVVDFESTVYSYQDNVPIRTVTITFPTPTSARWELHLSHNIDVPFGRVDPVDDDDTNNRKDDPPPTGIVRSIDEFDRLFYLIPDGFGWGTATSGYLWDIANNPQGGHTVQFYVDNDFGVEADVGYPIDVPGDSLGEGMLPFPYTRPFQTQWLWRMQVPTGWTLGWNIMFGFARDSPGVGQSPIWSLNPLVRAVSYHFSPGPAPDPPFTGSDVWKEAIGGTTGEWRYLKMEIDDAGQSYFKCWPQSGTEPDAWDYISPVDTKVGTDLNWFWQSGAAVTEDGFYFSIDWIRQTNGEYQPFDINDVPILIDGVYHTQYPYMSGSLRVYCNGNEIFEFDETSNTLGTFTITEGIAYGEVTCSYTILNQANPVGGDVAPGSWQFPAQGYVTQEFGCTGFYLEPPRGSCEHFHDGIDIANRSGTHLVAPTNGVVGYVGWNPYDTTDPAFIISIDAESGGYRTGMAHLQPVYVVHTGDIVTKGQLVGYMGSTGNSTGPHCHWEVYLGNTPIDPRSLL